MMKVEAHKDYVMLDGYVNAAGRDSRIIPSPRGGFIEQVTPGTFRRALGRGKPVELRHNHGRVIGSTENGTVELYEDNIGLRVKAKTSDPEVVERARKGELRGWSFGFLNPKDRWEERASAPPRRYLDDFDMYEVSVIDRYSSLIPMYSATSIEVRGGEEVHIEHRATEDEPELTVVESAVDDSATEERAIAPDNNAIMAGYRARRLKLS